MFTFYKAQGMEIGSSLLEADKVELAKKILDTAKEKNIQLLLPVDCVIADRFANDANRKTVDVNSIPAGWSGLDIGPKTIELFSGALAKAKTIVWNGPMGVFEMKFRPRDKRDRHASCQAYGRRSDDDYRRRGLRGSGRKSRIGKINLACLDGWRGVA